MPPSKRKSNGKSNGAQASQVKAARTRVQSNSASDDATEHRQAFAPTHFEAVLSTKDTFDVADHGEVTATTTQLSGALIGKALRLNNSAWPGRAAARAHVTAPAQRPLLLTRTGHSVTFSSAEREPLSVHVCTW